MGRIVIPGMFLEGIMTRIHAGHQEVTKCQELAEQSVWWPSMNTDIKRKCMTYTHCEAHRST